MTDYGIALLPQHADLLRASGIEPDVAAEREYVSADTKAGLHRLGFGPSAQLPPALVLPIWSVTGERVGAQIRPDEPRYKGERAVKYETPHGFTMRLDCHPRVRPHLGDPSRVLVFTEGIRKADAATSRGIDAVALLGVWNWRGTNKHGGKVALPDLHFIAWDNRTVVITFDSDVMLKADVHAASGELGALLTSLGANVGYVYLPSGEGGAKVGLDDYLAADSSRGIDDLLHLARPDLLPPPGVPRTDRVPEPEWDGVVPLPAVRQAIKRYVVLPDEHAAVALALWVVHTYLTEHIETTARVSVQSPDAESGKTRLLEVLAKLAYNARVWTMPSPAVLYRRIAQGPVTVLLDEVDNVFTARNDPDKADLRAVINEGHRKGATVPRCVGPNRDQVEEFNVFAPMALAGIGTLPDTLLSRSIIVRMRRRRDNELVTPFREREAREYLDPLRDQVQAWATEIGDLVADYRPKLPDGVIDRMADSWEPLLAIAELAGPDEAEQARAACTALAAVTRDRARSLGIRLLTDCRTVFRAAYQVDQSTALYTADLLTRLIELPDSPWGSLHGEPLDARGLARLVGRYDVHSRDVALADGTKRGYTATGHPDSFIDAWKRYCPDDRQVAEGTTTHPSPSDIPLPGSAMSAMSTSEDSTHPTHRTPAEGDIAGSGVVHPPPPAPDSAEACAVCAATEGLTYIVNLDQHRCADHPPEELL